MQETRQVRAEVSVTRQHKNELDVGLDKATQDDTRQDQTKQDSRAQVNYTAPIFSSFCSSRQKKKNGQDKFKRPDKVDVVNVWLKCHLDMLFDPVHFFIMIDVND